MRVLLIEDNPGDVRLIREMLRESNDGDDLATAARLSTGLEHLHASGADVVLLDLSLPDSHGVDTVVKTHQEAEDVPIVVLTGTDDDEVATKAVQAGAQDYLVKGRIDSDLLHRAVRYAVERHHLLSDLAKRAREVEQSESRQRTIISSAEDGIFVVDKERRVRFANRAAGNLLDRSAANVIGERLDFPVQPGQPAEIEVSRRGGAAGFAELRAVEIDWEGDPSYLLLLRDITERKVHEKERERLVAELTLKNRELDSFAHTVSHDLSEPLRAVRAFSKFLLQDYGERLDEQARDYLTMMNRASERMKHLIDDLLTLARVGGDAEAMVRVELGPIVHDLLEDIDRQVREVGAVITVDDTMPAVRADPVRVEQILRNLISNALKFNRSACPEIAIGVKETGACEATLTVRDNGIGIDPANHERIFGVFQRLHRREDYEGTGAGLAIVKRAANACGGDVWVESARNKGATFFVRLPLWHGAGATEEEA